MFLFKKNPQKACNCELELSIHKSSILFEKIEINSFSTRKKEAGNFIFYATMPRRVKSLFHDGDAPDSTELHRRLAVRSERTGTGHDLADYGQALHDAVTPHCSTPEEALAELAAGAADAEGRWVDRSFAGRDAIGDLKCRDRVQWLPIRKVFGIRAAFEVDGLTTSDIRQGSLGDCVRVRNQNKKEKKQKKEQTPLACPLTSLFLLKPQRY
jgi:hypothetical protein